MDPARIAQEWRCPEQQPVHHLEHRGVGADAEPEGQDHGGSEAGTATQGPERIAQVLRKDIQEAEPARIAALLLHLFHSAELHARLPRRLLRRESRLLPLFCLVRQVRLQLLVEVLLHCAATEEGAEPVAKVGEHLVHHRQVIPRTRETAVVRRCQSSASTLSCFWPARVSS